MRHIDQVQAGLELDTLIAELVFKDLKPKTDDTVDLYIKSGLFVSKGRQWIKQPIMNSHKWEPIQRSGHIAAAWGVVEKLTQDAGMICSVERLATHEYHVRFFNATSFELLGIGISKDAPIAICHAALKALGIEWEVE